MVETLFGLLVLSPLVGFFINGVRFRSSKIIPAGIIGSSTVFISFLSAAMLFFHLLRLPVGDRVLKMTFFNWLSVGELSVDFAFTLDPISSIMILVVTGVGFLIHLFSIGYMLEDPRPAKYFCYLNLFLFNMLILVLGSNLLVMFVGWEGVGLCSYFLIGFWFSDAEKATAGMKAFITNRIGDVGFLLGIFFLYMHFGTIDFSDLVQHMPATATFSWLDPLSLACLFLFIGATGKSAQIPLYIWLPDAMAGPTPVSALIHAATMVTAGVYMIIRMNGIFILAPNVMMLIAVIGAVTALGAATIGLTQWDIKKVLAYSTISQLGYMFLAVGVGAFTPALFHLVTHAFFKALMFLGAGSVIHGVGGEQDMRKMGGLRKWMPVTHATFLMGWLAIIGTPFFSGFFSKDEILWSAYASELGHPLLWFVGLIAAGCTSFYMTRLVALTFWGKSRVDSNVKVHESPLIMIFPLALLAFLAVFSGYIGVPHILGDVFGHVPNLLHHWLENSVTPMSLMQSKILELSLMGISTSLAAIMVVLAYIFYIKSPEKKEIFVEKFNKPYQVIFNKYYLDEIYFAKIIHPIIELSKNLWMYVDIRFIDRSTYLISSFVKSCGAGARSMQNGNMQNYAMYMSVGLGLIISYVLTSNLVFIFFIAVVFLCMVISSFLLRGK